MSKKRAREIEIPGDVSEEILAKLPAKSWLRFACVSKEWCSLFRNPTFISKHLLNGSSVSDHALLNLILGKPEFNQKFSLLESPPDRGHLGNLDSIKHAYIVGQCHGLICYMSGFKKPMADLVRRNVVLHLWNPAIGQVKILPKSNILHLPPPFYGRRDRFGFGHDPKSGDYKVVRFALYNDIMDGYSELLLVKAETYSLRAGSWRPVACSPIVLKGRPEVKSIGVCLGGFCYWMGYTFSRRRVPMIISYDLSNEVFRQYLVTELIQPYPYNHVCLASKIFVWKGSLTLVMFPFSRVDKGSFIDIWSFEFGVDSPLTLKEHLDLDPKEHLVTTALNDVEFLLNDDLILTYDTLKVKKKKGTTLKAFNISTRQMRNISSVEIGSYSFTLQIVGYTPSLVSLF